MPTATQNAQNENKRRKLLILRSILENERSTFLSQWRDLGQNVAARRMRFAVSDVNRGDRRNNNIINNCAVMALRTLRSGMMAGITSPARPWFRLTTPDPDMTAVGPVKLWLDQVTNVLIGVFLKSNLYNVLPIIYGDMGQFATSAMLVEEDFDETMRFYPFPIGSYMIAVNDKGRVDTFCRDFRMTVKQVVQKYGKQDDKPFNPKNIEWSKLSLTVKNYWESNQRELWVDIVHLIEPNEEHDEAKAESKFKKYKSVYFERGSVGGEINDYTGPEDDKFLSEKGYDYFPVLCPRWEVAAEDAYGTSCPGMDAIGDIKGLQTMERRCLQAVDKIVNPPMIAPTSMRNSKTSILPGDISYADIRDGQQGFKPVYEVRLSINEVQAKINETERRIDQAYFKDLFLMFADDQRLQPATATEVDEKKQEKLLALGPVLEQLNQDLLDPLIEIAFMLALRQRILPPPPQELQGMPLKVEYLSIMAQAQKVAGISGIERFANFVGNVSQTMGPDILDKIDSDKLADVYGDMTSVPPQILRSDEAVAQIRKQKQQAQQQQQDAELANQRTQAAKNLSQTDTGGNNALTTLINQSQAGQLVPQ